jgi:probable HAF family extracellular repeat protein
MKPCLLVGLLVASVPLLHAQSRYALTDLGTLGGQSSYARGINDSGVVVGYSTLSTGTSTHAFLFRDGIMHDLGLLGGLFSVATEIESSGVAIGYSSTSVPNISHAFRYQNGVMTDLGSLGGSSSYASGINNAGVIVGQSNTSGGNPHPVRYENGVWTDLGTLGGRLGAAVRINRAGLIVGNTQMPGDSIYHAFLYQNGSMSDLGTLGGPNSYARGINASGTIVGQSSVPGAGTPSRPFVYRNGTMNDLGSFGGPNGSAEGINDAGTIVGYSSLTASIIHAFVHDHGVMTDLNAVTDTSGGWLLEDAVDINSGGDIVGYGKYRGLARAFLLQPQHLVFTAPRAGERWISGDLDTIRWSGGRPGHFVNIELSADSGLTYTAVSLPIPADAGSYIWSVPDSLTTRARLVLIDAIAGDTLALSDTFKIKGYVLTRITPDGRYEAFSPAIHGWSYQNGSLWPQSWWSQFHYATAIDPYTNKHYTSEFYGYPDSNFVDWPLRVRVFSVDSSYWSTFFHIYRGRALAKWSVAVHLGSCFGFAASSFLAFNFTSQFLAMNPGSAGGGNLFTLPLNNAIRSTINAYYLFQDGVQSLTNDVISKSKDPRTTLKEIREMFRKDVADIRTITIFNNPNGLFRNAGGAHTLAPVKIVNDNTGPSRYRVMLYDSNNPGSNTVYILFDSLSNTWSDFTGLGPTWTGTKGCYLEIPVSNYLTTPAMGKPNQGTLRKGTGTGNIQFYNTSKADVMYTASNGMRMGFVGGTVTDEIPGGIVVFDKNGRPSNPIGYYVPDDVYSIAVSNIADSSKRVSVSTFKENTAYEYARSNAAPSQIDLLTVHDGFSVVSPDAATKQFDLRIIAELGDSERLFSLRKMQMTQHDSVYVKDLDHNQLIVKNFGAATAYDLALEQRSATGQKVFEHASITLQGNSSHIVVPRWDSLGHSAVVIHVDLSNNGTIDDSLVLANQSTEVGGQGPLGVPAECTLAQNYPNPFNPTTTIRYGVPGQTHVTLTVYNVMGQEVATLVNMQQAAGYHEVRFDASGLASGVYFYRIQAGTHMETMRMLLLR